MDKLLTNRLLLATIAALALYWTFGLTLPNGYMSVAVSAALFAFGGLSCWQYTPDAYRVLFFRERSDHAKGAHLATYGVWLLSAGAVWVGISTMAWYWNGQPESWLGSPVLVFGRAMISGGFFLMYLAPEASAENIRINAPMWIAAAIAAGLALGAVVGFQWTVKTAQDPWFRISARDANATVCPPDMPVWISKQSQRYHLPDSPYRALVVPSRCFATEDGARSAGYLPAVP